ncbi:MULTISPECIES: phage tail tape measure protein [unclassified Shinella]|uniref:phage tail tape measure protein n=1 Tax=unclassified Shinella TaxID=2643062 RepID=UPI00225D92E1|nr:MULTISPECIES: phage tail tape measure protein [unclassified Shinella]MCO5136229.1 phage tail tape measure protein [Shinella sp.]MDC7254134.1 phage tail tape measure protein [Shinella sp. YE25]CAI0336803.1 Phage tail protein [Rhizobiaceae bacterium]CAK7255330.1 Phage tail protein [Shinella sp. WSC3-e]
MADTDDRPLAGTLDDAGQLSAIFDDLEARSRSFGAALTNALKGAVVDGKGLESVLRGLALRMSDIALSVGLKPLEGFLSTGFSGLLGGATPFAKGGVVASPTYFGTGGGLGLMGEAGAEAILPLKRGPDGALGVAGEGGGTRIVFNVTAQDAASFRKSEGQIAAMLTRAVGRGQRSL